MAATIRVAVPRTVEQATETADLVARLDHQIAAHGVQRDASIAQINAAADAAIAPVIEERHACAVALQAWWTKAGHKLLTGKRKTLELGGCMIGTKAAPIALLFALGDDKLAAKTLYENKWSKGYARVTVSVDKPAVKTALAGKDGDKLRALGFGTSATDDVFVLEAVKQAGTLA